MNDDPRHDAPRKAPAQVTGVAHVFAAASYSVSGLQRLWRETAFRHQVLLVALLLPIYVAAHAKPFEIMVFLILGMIGWAFEAINTAIEELTDRVSPEWSEAAKNAKDLGSLAVAFGMGAHAILLAYVLIT